MKARYLLASSVEENDALDPVYRASLYERAEALGCDPLVGAPGEFPDAEPCCVVVLSRATEPRLLFDDRRQVGLDEVEALKRAALAAESDAERAASDRDASLVAAVAHLRVLRGSLPEAEALLCDIVLSMAERLGLVGP